MRVGNPTYYRNNLSNIMQLQREQFRLGKEFDTGQRVNTPSDDSTYALTILTSRYALDQVKQYRNNLETAQSWLKASENSMESMVSSLTRARTLAEQIANGTYTPEQFPAVASEVQRIIGDMIVLGNSMSNGSYIFGGTDSNYPPVSQKVVLAYPASLHPLGHNTASRLYDDGGGSLTLRLSRIDSGRSSTLQIAAGNTLGNSLGLDFSRDNWEIAGPASERQGQTLELNENFSDPNGGEAVSSRAGESFSWLADTETGWQTFRTWASVAYIPGETVTVNGENFTAADAQHLANLINLSGSKEFSAVLDGGAVKIISHGNPLDVSAATASTVDQQLSVGEFNAHLENGLQAQGSLTLDGDSFTFPPLDSDYVRLGDFKVTWDEVRKAYPANPFASAQDYAQGLSEYFNSHTGQYTASVAAYGNTASVQIEAAVAGKAGNVVLESSSSCAATSGSLHGGMDPMGNNSLTPGIIHSEGYSDLTISTTVKGQVVSVTEGANGLESVIVALDWVDDTGAARHTEVDLRNGGASGKVLVPELGENFYLYRDNQNFSEGAAFELKLGYLHGNQEDINTLYSQNNDMRYNWSAWQVLGDNMRMDLRGVETVPRTNNSGNGLVSLSGFYHGLYAQELTFDIIEGGQLDDGMVRVRASWIDENGQQQQRTLVLDNSGTGGGAVLPILDYPPRIDLSGSRPRQTGGASGDFKGQIVMEGDYRGLTSCDFDFTVVQGGVLNTDNTQNTPVKVLVSWMDDQGVEHNDEFEFSCGGENFAVEIPGADGLKFYLDAGEYQADPVNPDTFRQSVIMSPENAADGFFFQLEPGNYEAGDSFYVDLNPSGQHVLDILQQWSLALNSGDQEFGQTWSQRALVELKEAQENILNYTADSGARQNRISGRTAVLNAQELFNDETLVALQEVDSSTVLLEMQRITSNYNDVLKVTSQVRDLFLLNYL